MYGPNNESFVTCDCGCNESQPAAMWYNKTKMCAKGNGPSEAFLSKFKVIEILGKVAKKAGKPKKKDAESASTATTPTKDSANSEDAEGEKPAAKKAKKAAEKEPKPAKESKKEKKEKSDEPKEKRPLSAYMLWAEARREEFKQANEGKNISMTELGAEWKLMSDEDKKVWQDQAAANKEAAGPSAAQKRAAGT